MKWIKTSKELPKIDEIIIGYYKNTHNFSFLTMADKDTFYDNRSSKECFCDVVFLNKKIRINKKVEQPDYWIRLPFLPKKDKLPKLISRAELIDLD